MLSCFFCKIFNGSIKTVNAMEKYIYSLSLVYNILQGLGL